MKILRSARAAEAPFPRVLLVHLGDVEAGEAFFEKRWPEAVAIADPGRELYEAFGLERARLGQVLSPRVLARGVVAAFRGGGPGKPVGDVMQMPGAFLIHDGEVVWHHAARYAGDHPDLDEIRRVADSLSGSVTARDEHATPTAAVRS